MGKEYSTNDKYTCEIFSIRFFPKSCLTQTLAEPFPSQGPGRRQIEQPEKRITYSVLVVSRKYPT
jgi:hypothetical protein